MQITSTNYGNNQYSTGNLITYPHFSKTTSPVDTKNMSTINSCEDLKKIDIKSIKSLIININKDQAFDIDKQYEYTKCLKEYSTRNTKINYILKNSFFDGGFPTTKLYVFYHYYLTLHQNNDNYVGIFSTRFHELLYGFQDFSLININEFMNISNNKNDFVLTLNDWLNDYQSITKSPIYLLE